MRRPALTSRPPASGQMASPQQAPPQLVLPKLAGLLGTLLFGALLVLLAAAGVTRSTGVTGDPLRVARAAPAPLPLPAVGGRVAVPARAATTRTVAEPTSEQAVQAERRGAVSPPPPADGARLATQPAAGHEVALLPGRRGPPSSPTFSIPAAADADAPHGSPDRAPWHRRGPPTAA